MIIFRWWPYCSSFQFSVLRFLLLVCFRPVSCVSNVACLWIVIYWFPLRFSLTLLIVFILCLVYSMLYVSLDCPLLVSSSVVSNVYLLSLSCVLCMLYVSLDCPLLVSSSVISNVYLLSLYCVLCIQCCMCLWIVHY